MKSFIIAPVLIWVVIGLLTLVVVKNAYENSEIPYEKSELTKYNQPIETPTPEPIVYMGPIDKPADDPSLAEDFIPEPTVVPSPIPTKILVTHDGTRTGNIIKYFELATGQEIGIYENELLPYKINGKDTYLTQGDIIWYENRNNLPQASTTQLNQPKPYYPSYNYQPYQFKIYESPTFDTYKSPTPPPEFGKGYVKLNPDLTGEHYKGYDNNGNTVYLKPDYFGRLYGTDSYGNNVRLEPTLDNDSLRGFTNNGSYYLKYNSITRGYSGSGY